MWVIAQTLIKGNFQSFASLTYLACVKLIRILWGPNGHKVFLGPLFLLFIWSVVAQRIFDLHCILVGSLVAACGI